MIYDRCAYCHKRIPAGTRCPCRKTEKRIYQKKDSSDRYVAFYSSADWQRVREAAKGQYDNLDLYSLYILNKIEQADTVHHIVPVRKAWEKRYSLANLIPLTHRNHKLIHRKMEAGEDVAALLTQLKARYQAEFGGKKESEEG